MVGAPAAADAVERARRVPSLKVGLHVVLVRGPSVLSPEAIPDLVDGDGRFRSNLVRAGIDFFFRPSVRRQLEAEIRAQFQAFRETGLPLDHVNAHNHMHVHPTVLRFILKVGRDYGLAAVRVPYEPFLCSWRASRDGLGRRLASGFVVNPWGTLTKARLRRANVRCNDYLFGLSDSGRMNAARVVRYIAHLPPGVSEIYFHPATSESSDIDSPRARSEGEQELRALTDAAVKAALRESGVERIAFGDLAAIRP